jgi:hypothetical protein
MSYITYNFVGVQKQNVLYRIDICLHRIDAGFLSRDILYVILQWYNIWWNMWYSTTISHTILHTITENFWLWNYVLQLRRWSDNSSPLAFCWTNHTPIWFRQKRVDHPPHCWWYTSSALLLSTYPRLIRYLQFISKIGPNPLYKLCWEPQQNRMCRTEFVRNESNGCEKMENKNSVHPLSQGRIRDHTRYR